jgi:hypothetical protein
VRYGRLSRETYEAIDLYRMRGVMPGGDAFCEIEERMNYYLFHSKIPFSYRGTSNDFWNLTEFAREFGWNEAEQIGMQAICDLFDRIRRSKKRHQASVYINGTLVMIRSLMDTAVALMDEDIDPEPDDEGRTIESVNNRIYREEMHELIRKTLPHREAAVMDYRIFSEERMTLEQVAAKMGFTRNRACQLEQNALRRCRHFSRLMKIDPGFMIAKVPFHAEVQTIRWNGQIWRVRRFT